MKPGRMKQELKRIENNVRELMSKVNDYSGSGEDLRSMLSAARDAGLITHTGYLMAWGYLDQIEECLWRILKVLRTEAERIDRLERLDVRKNEAHNQV